MRRVHLGLYLAMALLLAGMLAATAFEDSDAATPEHAEAGEPGVPDAEQPPPQATDSMASTMIRAGLGPEELSAAGVSAERVVGIVASFRAADLERASALEAADAAVFAARNEVNRLDRLVLSRVGSPSDVQGNAAAYDTACATLSSAEEARNNILDQLFSAATSNLTEQQVQALNAIRSNERWKRPTPYLVVDRPEADWVRLRDCLGNERTAPELGEAADAECQSFLATVRGRSEVATALASYASNFEAVEATWNLALSE